MWLCHAIILFSTTQTCTSNAFKLNSQHVYVNTNKTQYKVLAQVKCTTIIWWGWLVGCFFLVGLVGWNDDDEHKTDQTINWCELPYQNERMFSAAAAAACNTSDGDDSARCFSKELQRRRRRTQQTRWFMAVNKIVRLNLCLCRKMCERDCEKYFNQLYVIVVVVVWATQDYFWTTQTWFFFSNLIKQHIPCACRRN